MKIKTKALSYDEVMALPRPEHKPPQKPNPLLRLGFRLASAPDLKATRFSFTTEDMEKVGEGPYLILMNHSSFIDLEMVTHIFRNKPYCIVCTSDGFVGKEGLMRGIGCIPTNKFATDMTLMTDMYEAIHRLGCSVLLYPEASYTFDGSPTPLPRKLGVMLKRLDAPVVGILTQGAFSRDPLYNCLQKRDVTVTAHVKGLLSREELKEKSNAQLDALLDDMFSFDNFRWQQENRVRIPEPFRADGLERILYKCPHCGAEARTEGKGTQLCCHACGKVWELDEYGFLRAQEGETEFAHIPDWYAWERQQVKQELEAGTYLLDIPVEIGMLVDFKAVYRIGEGRLRHDLSGFTLDGAEGKLHFVRPANQCYSLYADYYWYELGDIICIGDQNTQYYCFPKQATPVAKARLATEELYKLRRASRKKRKAE